MNIEELIKETSCQFVRSSGAGGQHVNKVATKVVLRFDVIRSKLLNSEQKERILRKLAHKISKEGIIILSSGATRSQLKNKKQVLKKFQSLIQNALIYQKTRKATKRPKSANLKRLEKKRNTAQKKINRQKPKWD